MCPTTLLSTDVAVAWATSRIKVPVNDALVARRMDAVRIFARHQQTLDPATQVPAKQVCNRRISRVSRMCSARHRSTPCWLPRTSCHPRFRALTWRNLIGLLATTGMRPGEACRLSMNDLDLPGGTIHVVNGSDG